VTYSKGTSGFYDTQKSGERKEREVGGVRRERLFSEKGEEDGGEESHLASHFFMHSA
jgi:hypothetical protein